MQFDGGIKIFCVMQELEMAKSANIVPCLLNPG